MYKKARIQAGIGLEEAALRLHVAPRTLSKYEAGHLSPPAEIVLKMACLYQAPILTLQHCRCQCSIGSAYSYEILHGINTDPTTVMLKLREELIEATEALNKMLVLVVNKNSRDDFTPAEWSVFEHGLQEQHDCAHTISVLQIAVAHWCDTTEQIAQHNLKCQQRGYTQKKTASKAARKTLTYSLA